MNKIRFNGLVELFMISMGYEMDSLGGWRRLHESGKHHEFMTKSQATAFFEERMQAILNAQTQVKISGNRIINEGRYGIHIGSKGGRQWRGFTAGISAAYISILIFAIVTAHGSRADQTPTTWPDIAGVLLMMLLFADSAVEIYKFWKQR